MQRRGAGHMRQQLLQWLLCLYTVQPLLDVGLPRLKIQRNKPHMCVDDRNRHVFCIHFYLLILCRTIAGILPTPRLG